MNGPLTVDTVLTPTDGSDAARTAVEYAVSIASTYGATLHVMYVLGDETTRAIEAGELTPAEAIETAQSVLTELDRIAARKSVPTTHSTAHGFSTRRKLVHPGSVILDTAEQTRADFVVIPRERPTEDHVDGLEKAAEYVLAYASQPVLSV